MKHLKYYGLFSSLFIPKKFKCNIKNYQLELLAGILDSCAILNKGCYEVMTTNKVLLDDLIYLSRSPSYAAYRKLLLKVLNIIKQIFMVKISSYYLLLMKVKNQRKEIK